MTRKSPGTRKRIQVTSTDRGTIRRFTLTLVLLAAASLLPQALETPESRAPAAVAKAPIAEQVGLPVEAKPVVAGLRAGTELEYSYFRKIELDSSLLAASSPIEYQARLFLRVARKLPNGGWLCEAELKADRANKALSFARVELSKTLEIASLEGRLQDEAGQALRDALASWAFFGNQDTTGTFRSRLTRDRELWTKNKLEYVSFAGGNGPAPRIERSVLLMRWNPNVGAPQALEGAEDWSIGAGNDSRVVLSHKMNLVAVRRAPASFASLRLPPAQLAQVPAVQAVSQDLRFTQARPWPELTRAVEGADSLPARDRLSLFNELLSALRANPALASDLESIARRYGPAGARAFSLAVGALATNASPEAQEALRSLYQDGALPESSKGQILAAWTTTDGVLDAQTRDLLRRESEGSTSLASGAAYALGSALRAGADAESVEQLRKLHASARTESDREKAIEAMGNSGRNEFIGSLKRELAHEDERVRATAAFSLRLIPGEEARESLRAALSDTNPKVRASAAEALRFRPAAEGWAATLRQCSKNDPVPGVRDVCSRVNQSVQTEFEEKSQEERNS